MIPLSRKIMHFRVESAASFAFSKSRRASHLSSHPFHGRRVTTFFVRIARVLQFRISHLIGISRHYRRESISPMAVSMTRLGDQTNRGSIFRSLKFAPTRRALTRDYLRSMKDMIEKFANSDNTEITPSGF